MNASKHVSPRCRGELIDVSKRVLAFCLSKMNTYNVGVTIVFIENDAIISRYQVTGVSVVSNDPLFEGSTCILNRDGKIVDVCQDDIFLAVVEHSNGMVRIDTRNIINGK